jgi:hypothetical protein
MYVKKRNERENCVFFGFDFTENLFFLVYIYNNYVCYNILYTLWCRPLYYRPVMMMIIFIIWSLKLWMRDWNAVARLTYISRTNKWRIIMSIIVLRCTISCIRYNVLYVKTKRFQKSFISRGISRESFHKRSKYTYYNVKI